ncbi:MAG: hypothetical protein K0S47_4783 [Herbinix sp.]|jgi:phosphatidylglycerol lysyltransferase|nr:hypothetical protein [Herbinix sp.]
MEYLYDNIVEARVLVNDSSNLEYLVKIYGKDSLNYLSFENET